MKQEYERGNDYIKEGLTTRRLAVQGWSVNSRLGVFVGGTVNVLLDACTGFHRILISHRHNLNLVMEMKIQM